MKVQLYASIRRSSKYHYQNKWAEEKGEFPFPVDIDPAAGEYAVQGGPGGQYRLKDVNLHVIVDGQPFKLA